jgi:hypothetical protein
MAAGSSVPDVSGGEHSPGSEREGLATVLDVQRAALIRKVHGVSEPDARRVPTASALSLLALLKHCAIWEERWFQGIVSGAPLADGWPEQESATSDADFLLSDADTVDQWLTRYREATEVSRGIAAARELDAPCARTDVIDCNVRWVLLHLIEETARHAGHADIIRETLDGSRGM